jgi:hypothetical protein
MMDSTPLPENHRTFPRHWTVLGLLVIAHVVLGMLLYPSIQTNPSASFYASIISGFLYSQPILFAFWTGFAPQRFSHRFFPSLLFCSLIAFLLELEIYSLKKGFTNGSIIISYINAFFVATLILLLVRRLTRLQLVQRTRVSPFTDYQANQFGIKHLLILTLITAIICSLFRTLAMMGNLALSFSTLILPRFVFQAFLFSSPIIFIPWLTLTPHRYLWRSLFFAFIMSGFVDVVMISAPAKRFIPIPPASWLILFQLGAALSVLLTTLVMRFCGFRMVRVQKSAAQAVES